MTRLPRVTGTEVVRTLGKAGFFVTRQRGSHAFLKHADGRKTTVPVHAGEVIGPGLMSDILRDTEITPEEFRRLLRG